MVVDFQKQSEKYVIGKDFLNKRNCLLSRARLVNSSKKRNIIFGHLPPKNISELKTWDLVHVDLIGPHSKSIRQKQPGSAIIRKNVSLTCMRMIDPVPGWLEIVEIPTFNLYEVIAGNDEYIYK